ncbi:MAG: hypothetical protein A2020_02880 [Lentisphaerae bacterium GWF2_45_14]|nr:MAG: hypothetical protein A2020_02880 [Lentisphaerae bacterium GWF2_45_14]
MALEFSSGNQSLDNVLGGVRAGDNCVWQVDAIENYRYFVSAFVKKGSQEGKKIIYFRFGQHDSVVPADVPIDIYTFSPENGFEKFLFDILDVIDSYPTGTCYVFDSLSDLAVDWNSDRMLGCFFMLTCPHLFKLETVAYFVLLRNHHGPLALDVIHKTAQIVVDVYSSRKHIYIQPIKVKDRHSATMYMIHICRNDIFTPETRSYVVSKILGESEQGWLDFNIDRPGIWTNLFITAKRVHEHTEKQPGVPLTGIDKEKLRKKLIKMIITHDESVFELSCNYFSIADLIAIAKRMIGTGQIGGKSVGMLLANAIMRKASGKWVSKLETNDSFYIGSDVFYTYIIQNDCWWDLRKVKKGEGNFSAAKTIQEKVLKGSFPKDIEEKFKDILNYYGQSPIIVRSSSLLEDAYGNAFSGKYESYFCVNQGTREERLEAFILAMKKVYASTMNLDALAYRHHRGLLNKEERMGLLIQRVSGNFHDFSYFPQIAGVGYSFNPFVWNSKIDPSHGVLRLVFGLGTRAVDQTGGDHARIVAIDQPHLRPETNPEQIIKYSQRVVDILNIKANQIEPVTFRDIGTQVEIPAFELFATKDPSIIDRAWRMKAKNIFPWVLSFDGVLDKTSFIKDMGEILKTLENAYKHPVDIEFTANFASSGDYRINIVQCRPFHFAENKKELAQPDAISEENIILKTKNHLLGQSKYIPINKIIYILPEKYSAMSVQDRYAVARLIGEVTNSLSGKDMNVLLIGPGRWGTAMPTLGIPVTFNEIKNVAALCELAVMHENLSPDISLGTHFFNDLVEMEIMYMAMNISNHENIFNVPYILNSKNLLLEQAPKAKAFQDSVKVVDTSALKEGFSCYMYADTMRQSGIIFLTDTEIKSVTSKK